MTGGSRRVGRGVARFAIRRVRLTLRVHTLNPRPDTSVLCCDALGQ